MRRGALAWCCVSAMLAGCGGDASGADDAAIDAADATTPPACASSSARLQLPTPVWESDRTHLTPPAGDRAVALLAPRPAWAPELGELDGWPRRPTVLVALDGEASDVDPGGVHLFDDGASSITELELPVAAWIEGGDTLVVVPDDPFPAGVERVVLTVDAGAITGAAPLPACDGDGPDAAYGEAAVRVGQASSFALPFRLTSRSRDLSRIRDALSAAPALTVSAARVLDPSTLTGDLAPSAEVLSGSRAPWVDGRLELPSYQDADGRFVLGADGTPEVQGTIAPGFTVVLPATGSAPYPFVLYQHGGGQHRHVALHIVGPLLAAGFAVVAIDLPAHGDLASAAGGSDLDILDFDDPLRSRDNLRQASADHLALLTGIEALNAAIESVTGVSGAFDPSHAYYAGLSLGGFTGSMTFAAAPEVRAAALFVAAGGYREVLGDGVFKLIVSDVIRARGPSRQASLALAEALLGAADPLAHAALERAAGSSRPLLLFEAIDDPLVPNAATDRWARVFGAELATPSHHSVEGLADTPLPFTGSPTRLLIQAPMAEVAVPDRHGALIEQGYSEDAVAHCFVSERDGGACELVDTGWAIH